MEDREIIRLFFVRSEQAIEELDRKYGTAVKKTAANILGDRLDVEECVNDTYLGVWNSIPPNDPQDLKTYLCRIVRNIAIKRYQYNSAEKRNPQFTVSIEEISECTPAADHVSDDDLADAFSRFLRTQDEKHRKVFIRRYWYGDSIADIASYYGMKEKTVATYLFRTRNKLKAFLKKEGYDYE